MQKYLRFFVTWGGHFFPRSLFWRDLPGIFKKVTSDCYLRSLPGAIGGEPYPCFDPSRDPGILVMLVATLRRNSAEFHFFLKSALLTGARTDGRTDQGWIDN